MLASGGLPFSLAGVALDPNGLSPPLVRVALYPWHKRTNLLTDFKRQKELLFYLEIVNHTLAKMSSLRTEGGKIKWGRVTASSLGGDARYQWSTPKRGIATNDSGNEDTNRLSRTTVGGTMCDRG